jgi:hypothetical protein
LANAQGDFRRVEIGKFIRKSEENMPTSDDAVIEAYFEDNDFERYSIREYEIDQLDIPLEETDPLEEKEQPSADGINRIKEAA